MPGAGSDTEGTVVDDPEPPLTMGRWVSGKQVLDERDERFTRKRV